MIKSRGKIIEEQKVNIIILNYNGWKDTLECLESILKSDYSNFQLIVIDNASPNNSLEILKKWAEGNQNILTPENSHPLYYLSHPPIEKPVPYIEYNREEAEKGGELKNETDIINKYFKEKKSGMNKNNIEPSIIKYPLIFIQTGRNLGFAGGINVGLKMLLARDEQSFIWLLNPDMVVEKGALRIFAEQSKFLENMIIGGNTVKNYDNPAELLFYAGAVINRCKGTVSFIKNERDMTGDYYVSGGSLFTNLNTVKRVGLLSENYFLYWEDADWCEKARKADIKFKIITDAIIYNKGSTSIGKGYKAEYYYSLGMLKFFYKNHKNRLGIIMIFNVLRILKRVIKGKYSLAKAIINANKSFLFKLNNDYNNKKI
jgi:GT2 family glycosyltransferase